MVTLFASARAVYRKCGFELAGSEMIYEAETSALPVRTDLEFRQVELDGPAIRRGYDRKTLSEARLLDRTERHWKEILRAPSHATSLCGGRRVVGGLRNHRCERSGLHDGSRLACYGP